MYTFRLIVIAAVVGVMQFACFPSSNKMGKDRERQQVDEFVVEANRELKRIKNEIDNLMLRNAQDAEVDQLLKRYERTEDKIEDFSESETTLSLNDAKHSIQASLRELDRSCRSLAHGEG